MRFTLDTHTHTIASGHAYNTIDEMAVYAAGHGVTPVSYTHLTLPTILLV